jgi:hypothetical protein
MLRTALSPAIRAAFDEYFIRFLNECLYDRLSDDDCGLIEKIQSFLSRLTHTTMSLSIIESTSKENRSSVLLTRKPLYCSLRRLHTSA